MKRTTREAARGSRGSTEKRYLALLSDWTHSLRDGIELRNEAQGHQGKTSFLTFKNNPIPCHGHDENDKDGEWDNKIIKI